ncbi:hypothetical protein [Streptomyces sp. NBC_01465]|uniref:hypothetical protein n=1 Tax=Streptomyces sp. NBC_01465 TaxID=2903878 RepID=UPI002E36D2B0|nr:hypothetical protein [Streptomyces sp. NBC_01465]
MLDTSRDDVTAPTAPLAAAPDDPVPEPRGCLYALSQPPLMIFLGVVGGLILTAALHDLFML